MGRLTLFVTALVALLFPHASPAQTAGRKTLPARTPAIISRLHLHSIRDLGPSNRLRLAVALPLHHQARLNQLLQEIYDPASPEYHHYLAPGQFAREFGPTTNEYDSVKSFFKTNGFTVAGEYSNRAIVDVEGSVGDINRVFHLTLRIYRHPSGKRNFYAPDTAPTVSTNLPIAGVSGLDNFTIPQPAIVKKKPAAISPNPVQSAGGSGPGGLYIGGDFRAAYTPGVTLNGQGQAVALVEFDGYYASDITAYEQQAVLPFTPLTNVLVDGFSGTPGLGNSEVALDIEMAVAMATNLSQVIVYQAPDSSADVADLLNRIASDDLASQISCSWLIGDAATFDAAYKQMALQGQTFFQASGDDGAYYSQIESVEQNADDTNVTVVGGTTLSRTGPGGAWSSETVWNWFSTRQGSSASGGGTNFNGIPIPPWQQGIAMSTNKGSTTLRNSPDVALTADNIFIVADNGQKESIGGTSASAPLWAAFAALINQQASQFGKPAIGFLNPALYAIGKGANYTADFHDITTGNNTNGTVANRYFAVAGYDLCTGWGTPDGQNLINGLVVPDTLGVLPETGFTAVGPPGGPFGPASQVFSVTNSTAVSLGWTLAIQGSLSSWLNASTSSGTLAAHSAQNITFNVNSSANSLATGSYPANVVFSNQTTHVTQKLTFTLIVLEPLSVQPASGFDASGAPGGPFTVTNQDFSLSNLASAGLNWQLGNAPSWLAISPSSGSLSGHGATTVTAMLGTNAYGLNPGVYSATIFFTNNSDHIVQSRAFTLSIGQSIVRNGGFETGDFADWTVNEEPSLQSLVDDGTTSGLTPHSGQYFAALMDITGIGLVSQTLQTVPGQTYLLSVWFNSPDISTNQQANNANFTTNTPNTFTVSWNNNTLFDETNIPPLGWTNLLFVVQATDTSTLLQFGEYVQWAFGLDDVSAAPMPAVAFRSTAIANNQFQLSWNAMTGLVYTVEYKTNLLQSNWIVLKTVTATNTPTVFTDTNPLTASPKRFYRLVLQPN